MLKERLKQDLQFYHKLRYAERKETFLSRVKLLLVSRGLFLLFVHRLYHYRMLNKKQHTGLKRMLGGMCDFSLIFMEYFVKIFTKSDIWHGSEIDGGVYLSDRGHIIIGAKQIGSGTIIHDRVTIGTNILNEDSKPEIGRNVWIGANTIIYGSVRVGDGVTFMPGVVLSKSVPAQVVLSGNPVKVVQSNFDNSLLRQSVNSDLPADLITRGEIV